MNVFIFKTSVQNSIDLSILGVKMDILLGKKNWSFAFEDVDKILRVVSYDHCVAKVIETLITHGFLCEELPYSLDEFKV